MKTTTANYTADTDRFALPGSLFDVAAHMDWDGELQAGEIIEARWTNSHRYHRAIAKVVRVNRKSIRVELMTAPDGYEVGQTFSVPRNVWTATTWSLNNGAFPARPIENPCQAELGSKPCENPANVRTQDGGTVEIDACDECAHALHEEGCAWEDGCEFCSTIDIGDISIQTSIPEADLPARPADTGKSWMTPELMARSVPFIQMVVPSEDPIADVLREILEHEVSRITPELRQKAWYLLRGGE